MSGRRIGSLIGAVGGLIFILVNAGALPDGLAFAVRALGTIAFIALLAFTVLRRGAADPTPPPDRRAWRTYWTMVSLEGLLLFAGTATLSRTGHPELGAAWVALIVGAHFLPFAKAFNVPEFRPLAWAMISLGLLGALLTISVNDAAGTVVAGVLSGLALFGFALRYGLTRPQPAT